MFIRTMHCIAATRADRERYSKELLFECATAQLALMLMREALWVNIQSGSRPTLFTDLLDVCPPPNHPPSHTPRARSRGT
jgi:hypothetical protein